MKEYLNEDMPGRPTRLPTPPPPTRPTRYADSIEFFNWPETQAMLKRLGVDITAEITSIEISASMKSNVTIKIEQLGVDEKDET